VSAKAFFAPTARVMAPGAPQQPARYGDCELANQYMRKTSEASIPVVAVLTRFFSEATSFSPRSWTPNALARSRISP
jgi:hypothetical protein